MPLPFPPERRFAAWKPGYAGAPPPALHYYTATLLCVALAFLLRYSPLFANLIIAPFQLGGGLIALLYRPVVRRRVLPLRDLPAAAAQYAVRVVLSRGVVYGTDEGLTSFVDGWLTFQGEGCAFSFRRSDVEIPRNEKKLDFPGGCRPHRLEFTHFEQGFAEAWDAWCRETPPLAGMPAFPPILPLARPRGWDHTLTAAVLGVAAFGLAFPTLTALPWLLLALATVLGFALRTRRQNDRALARLARNRPPRRAPYSLLTTNVKKTFEAIRTDLRRRRRHRIVRASLDRR